MKSKTTDPWFVKKLIALGACDEAIKYARKYRTFPAAWNHCPDDSWLGWLLKRLDYAWYQIWLPLESIDDPSVTIRRFPADRVAKKLRQV